MMQWTQKVLTKQIKKMSHQKEKRSKKTLAGLLMVLVKDFYFLKELEKEEKTLFEEKYYGNLRKKTN